MKPPEFREFFAHQVKPLFDKLWDHESAEHFRPMRKEVGSCYSYYWLDSANRFDYRAAPVRKEIT